MITVVISSHNGGGVLPRMLDALARVRAPAGGWRVIAVDNASTDDTRALLTSYQDRLPLEVLGEATPGKGHALNLALDHAEGDLIVFCDDDVVVSEHWLEAWRAVADAHPTFELFAGLTLPLWPSPPPLWITRHVDIAVAYAVHEGANEGPCEADRMHGTNMAIRAQVFAAGFRFNGAIGPDGTSTYAMGSETDLAIRLEAAGYKCWFTLEPVVQHIIRPEQMTRDWIYQRAYRFGRGEALLNRPHPVAPGALAAKNGVKSVLYPIGLAVYPEPARLRRRWQWAFDLGYEDATREKRGQKPRWRHRVARLRAGAR